jgi:hypothetical protein
VGVLLADREWGGSGEEDCGGEVVLTYHIFYKM